MVHHRCAGVLRVHVVCTCHIHDEVLASFSTGNLLLHLSEVYAIIGLFCFMEVIFA